MSYHNFLLVIGVAVFAAYWLPRFVSGREPAGSALLIGGGFVCAMMLESPPSLFAPIESPEWWETLSEMAVIVALFATGMRIDAVRPLARWRASWRLLAVAMPLTICAVALAGMAAGLPLASAILLGAVLAPTDPVLAGDVQVGPPREGGEHPVRFALTTEAGLNDGLAFPFVYLAIAAIGGLSGADFMSWFGYDFVYRIVAGAISGAITGWMLAQVVFNLSIEHTLTAVLLLMTGAALGVYWNDIRLEHVAIAASLIFVIRPLFGWLSLAGIRQPNKERFVIAAFGVRGIGSLYYLAFAAITAEVPMIADLWLVVLVSIAMSAVVHGLSAGAALSGIRADADADEDADRAREGGQ